MTSRRRRTLPTATEQLKADAVTIRTDSAGQRRQAEQPHAAPSTRPTGGYAGAAQSAGRDDAGQVIEMVKASNLRGRGGAGFPTGLKWSFLPKDHPGPIYMCINADESEPGTFNNRILMEDDPHQVLEGIILSCYATKAQHGLSLSPLRIPAVATSGCKRPSTSCYANNLLGKNILGKDFSLDIFLHRGAAAYICGEETGLIESLEGKRAWPRIKPPFPAVEGRLSQADGRQQHRNRWPASRRSPPAASTGSKSIGVPADPKNPRDPGSYGPKLYCLSGHVNKPGCYEAPLGITCRQLIDEYGGGVWKGRKAKAAIPGGISMGLLTEAEFDTPLDFAGPGRSAAWGWARPPWW